MKCNCDNDQKIIKHVEGNTLTCAIPLQDRITRFVDGEKVTAVEDFYPLDTDTVTVRLTTGFTTVIPMECQVTDNVVTFTDNGTLPAARYGIEITVVRASGDKKRYYSEYEINIVDETSEAGIPDDIEYNVETYDLEAAVFDMMRGYSAYEIWLQQGHTGTEEDFLEWLSGQGQIDAKIEEVYETIAREYVRKVTGMGLSQNDFTNILKTKLESLENYDDTQVRAEIKQVENTYVATTAQTFGDLQKKQARANIGLGNGDIDNSPTPGSENLVESVGVFNKTNSIEANVAAITGGAKDIPFVVGTVAGMISGTQLVYGESDSRLRVEMPTDKILTIKAKAGYKFTVCAFEDKIPTTKRQRLNSDNWVTSINIQNRISSITEFNPNRIVIVISNTDETVITGVESLDEVIKVTYLGSTLVDLSNIINVVNSGAKAAYIVGSHSYTTNSITFGEGSILAIKEMQKGSPITFTFDTETTYTFNATYRALIFDGETVSIAKNANVKESDVLLLIWSNRFVGGALYNDYQDYIYNTLKIVFTTGEVIYKNGGILFKAGSSLYYKDYDTGANKHIDFTDDTEYSSTQYQSLVLRDNTIIQTNPSGYLYNDVVLAFWRDNGTLVSGALFPEYINKNIPNKLTDIPFRLGSFKGASSNYIEYYDLASRISVELDTQNIATIKTKSGYDISAACLFEDSIPTSDFASITVNSNTVYIEEVIKQEYTFIPNKVILSIKKSDNTTFDIGLSSVEDIIDIRFASLPADKKITTQKNVIKCEVVRGALASTGYYPTTLGNINGYAHTPLFISIKDSMCTIKNTEILSGYIFYYDKNKDYVKKIDINTLIGGVVPRYVNTEYIRFSFNTNTNNSILPYNGIYLEGTWDDINRVKEYSNIPSDSGYTNMVFPVRINTNITPSTTVSSITEQYIYSENCGVLHLPASYSPIGKGTPLIIYLHGAQDRYTPSDKRFKVRFAQEWDAAGYAQMDVDMIPSLYNFTQSGCAGTGDDLACVEAAYNWAIKHYNIRRDGIYLFGRSRGGMAVLSILGKYNPVKLPIVCALSNAGANSMLLYALFRDSITTAWWNAFCTSTGLLNPPTIATNKPIVAQPTVASFLRDNIDKWWYKAMVALPMIVDNPTIYQTPEQIFDLLASSYSDTDEGRTFSENFVEQCKFRSPVPLRFDWCVGDTAQRWDIPWFYGLAGKNAFVNSKLVGNSIYREWPECTGGEPHYHEDYNIYNGDYTLPNGAVVTNPSMAQVEWLLWAQSHDNRDL